MSPAPGWLVAIGIALATAALAGLSLAARRRRTVARALGDPHLLRRLTGLDLVAFPRARVALVVAATLAWGASLLDPSLAAPPPAGGGPVVLLLDASASMLAEDGGASRLDVQRDMARRMVARLAGRPVGIVAFSGEAYSLTPPTRDARALAMYLDHLDPAIVSQTGSALGPAIRQGLALLAPDGRTGTLVLITDGDETAGREAALDAAALAGRSGAALHVVGVGTMAGGPVPAYDPATGAASGFLRDPAGEVTISRRDDGLLRSIAERAGGSYAVAEEGGDAAVLDRLQPRPPPPRPPRLPPYAWLAGAAFLLLLVEPLVERPRTVG